MRRLPPSLGVGESGIDEATHDGLIRPEITFDSSRAPSHPSLARGTNALSTSCLVLGGFDSSESPGSARDGRDVSAAVSKTCALSTCEI